VIASELSMDWVGLGQGSSVFGGFGWVGSSIAKVLGYRWVGLDRVTQSGPMDNSGLHAVALTG